MECENVAIRVKMQFVVHPTQMYGFIVHENMIEHYKIVSTYKGENIFLLLLLFFVLTFDAAYTQNTVLKMPPKYWQPCDTITKPFRSDFEPGDSADSLWLVFSDRAQNFAYNKYENNKVIDTLDFLEICAVLQIEDKRLKLGRVNERIQDKYIKEENTFWLDTDKLLLSPYCLVGGKFKTNKKALVINTGEKVSGTTRAILHKQPFTGNDTALTSLEFEHLCIYKVSDDGNFVFAGKYYRLPEIGNISSRENYGWIERKYLVPWNNRVAWEYKDTSGVCTTKYLIVPPDSIDSLLKNPGASHWKELGRKVTIKDTISKEGYPQINSVILVHNLQLIDFQFQLLKLKNTNMPRAGTRGYFIKLLQCISGDNNHHLNDSIFSQMIFYFTRIRMDKKFDGISIDKLGDPDMMQHSDILQIRAGLAKTTRYVGEIIEAWDKHSTAVILNKELYFWLPVQYLLPD